ncbi:hypothetical protein [Acidianus bottle-shaped virus]|uniref:Uncharacterized protein ORF188 n=1 Tax=Acidianus bottle-shaped virus (isolate Italy/Pozzuoli) TaxID=654911 RepID=Y118_ABVP|nr:hypothetical protein ABV_gp39 [Acidianus bottle-shaped virus]A4ZUC5.1 RecName: Full=Uncharacterized protein ORF188 [Acidianus bottle-shaped virus (isolate Pozzuoli)]ABP73429.1 hypothetical protein [Acidianus bottle-shaped virus]
MSLVESINKFLSFADHDLIVYDIILGSILGGIGVSFNQASLIDDFPNIIELIIGSMMLLNKGFEPFLRSLGFVLTADGFSSLVNKVFTSEECKNCIPFDCLIAPLPADVVYANSESNDPPLIAIGPRVFFNLQKPECREYFERLQKYNEQNFYKRFIHHRYLGESIAIDPNQNQTISESEFSESTSSE